jgi:hypothetical protein
MVNRELKDSLKDVELNKPLNRAEKLAESRAEQ